MNRLRHIVVLVFFLAGWTWPAGAQTAHVELDMAGVASVIRSFRAALQAGDTQAVEKLLAPDAVILEAGERESRKAYLEHHLHEDIKFARAVPSHHTEPTVQIAGDAAWAVSTSTTRGTFQSKPINLAGAELMVLSKVSGVWLIRAIHWSSRKAK